MNRPTVTTLVAVALVLSLTSFADAVTHKATAQLHGSAAMDGRARYIEKAQDGHLDQLLRVNVIHAHPFQLLHVRVNGHHVGVVHANALGVVQKKLHGQMPAIRTGDVVSVGCMCGVSFEDGENADVGFEGEAEIGDAEYEAQYEESMDDGTLERQFQVEVEGAAPGASLDVLVNGVFVGTLLTDAEGEGELEFRSSIDEGDGEGDGDGDGDGDGEAVALFPDNFPGIADGATVQVDDVTITLSATDGDEGEDD